MKKGKIKASKHSDNALMGKNELKNLIILVLVLCVIFFAFYGLTLLFDKKEDKQDLGALPETIQYNEIIIGEILNRPESEYYVLVRASKNNYNDLYNAYLNNYVTNNKEKKYYTVDLDNALNSPYVGDETNIDSTNFFNSKFADTTLILVRNKKVARAYSTHDEIFKLLQQIAA